MKFLQANRSPLIGNYLQSHIQCKAPILLRVCSLSRILPHSSLLPFSLFRLALELVLLRIRVLFSHKENTQLESLPILLEKQEFAEDELGLAILLKGLVGL
jgi:hypothetical protein